MPQTGDVYLLRSGRVYTFPDQTLYLYSIKQHRTDDNTYTSYSKRGYIHWERWLLWYDRCCERRQRMGFGNEQEETIWLRSRHVHIKVTATTAIVEQFYPKYYIDFCDIQFFKHSIFFTINNVLILLLLVESKNSHIKWKCLCCFEK